MKRWLGLAGVLLLLTVTACNSVPLSIPTGPIGPNEKKMGVGEGTARGLMIMGFIPVNQNERFVEAYQNALAQSGGSRLTDITVSESWFWAWVLNGYTFKVQGTGVAPK